MSDKQQEFDLEAIQYGQKIIKTLADLRPGTSLSFLLTEQGVGAVGEIILLTSEKMPGNMPKLRGAALEVLNPLTTHEAGVPRNVNLTEYEIKAMNKVLDLIEKVVG